MIVNGVTSCGLCEEHYTLVKNSYTCIFKACYQGCKHCDNHDCLICDEDYYYESISKICLRNTIANKISNCMYHYTPLGLLNKTTAHCYQCDDSYIASSDETSCLLTILSNCRVLDDTSTCGECLPQF